MDKFRRRFLRKVAAAFVIAMTFSKSVIAQAVNRITEGKRRKIAEEIAEAVRKLEEKHGLQADELAIVVNPERQELYLVKNHMVERVYPASTARRGLGTRFDSLQTPWGTHRIKEKIGAGAPLGTVFKHQENTGEIATLKKRGDKPARGKITTRIMWLDGQEQGVNRGKDMQGRVVDTHERYIYIHSLSAENMIGKKPCSSGCVVVKNEDVIELFDIVLEGTLVEILNREFKD